MLQKHPGVDDNESCAAEEIAALAVGDTKLWDFRKWRNGGIFTGFERTYEELKLRSVRWPSAFTLPVSNVPMRN